MSRQDFESTIENEFRMVRLAVRRYCPVPQVRPSFGLTWVSALRPSPT